jgi:hypothetical protein
MGKKERLWANLRLERVYASIMSLRVHLTRGNRWDAERVILELVKRSKYIDEKYYFREEISLPNGKLIVSFGICIQGEYVRRAQRDIANFNQHTIIELTPPSSNRPKAAE